MNEFVPRWAENGNVYRKALGTTFFFSHRQCGRIEHGSIILCVSQNRQPGVPENQTIEGKALKMQKKKRWRRILLVLQQETFTGAEAMAAAAYGKEFFSTSTRMTIGASGIKIHA